MILNILPAGPMLALCLLAALAKVVQYRHNRRRTLHLTGAFTMVIWASGYAMLYFGWGTVEAARGFFRIGNILICTQFIAEALALPIVDDTISKMLGALRRWIPH